MYVCISIGSGSYDRFIRVTFCRVKRVSSRKKIIQMWPDRSREINSIAFSQATGLHERVAWLNLAFELPSICIYFWAVWYHTRAVGHQSISLMTTQLASWPSSTKKYRYLYNNSVANPFQAPLLCSWSNSPWIGTGLIYNWRWILWSQSGGNDKLTATTAKRSFTWLWNSLEYLIVLQTTPLCPCYTFTWPVVSRQG